MPGITWRRMWAPDARDPAWMSDGVTKRPVLALPLDLLLVHYTGVTSRKYVGAPILQALRDLFTWAFANGKGDEYNYVITWDGGIYEWAGLSRGAHCSNKNMTSFGVLFMLAEGEVPTLEMAASLLWLRQHLVEIGALTRPHAVDQHGEHYPTTCPGVEVKKRWPMYDTVLPPAPPPPPPPTAPLEDSMKFWKLTDCPGYIGLAVIFAEVMPGLFIHVGPTDASRYAGGADKVNAWAIAQEPYPGGWAEFAPKFFPRA